MNARFCRGLPGNSRFWPPRPAGGTAAQGPRYGSANVIAQSFGVASCCIGHWSFSSSRWVAAVFGFGGIASTAAGMAQILFVVALVLFVVSLLAGFARGRNS